MRSCLLINQYYWPDEVATAQLLKDLAEDLVNGGYKVTVLCGRACYACRENLIAGSTSHRGIQIERVGGTDFGRFHWIGRIIDLVSFMWMAKRALNRIPIHDVVITMTSPPLVGNLGF